MQCHKIDSYNLPEELTEWVNPGCLFQTQLWKGLGMLMIWQNLLHHDPRWADVRLSSGRTDDPFQRLRRLISSAYFYEKHNLAFSMLISFHSIVYSNSLKQSYSKASPMTKSTGLLKLITLGSNNTFNHAFLMPLTSLWRNFGLVLFPIFYLISHTGGFQAWAAFFRPCHSISIEDHSNLQRGRFNFFSPTIFFYMGEK